MVLFLSKLDLFNTACKICFQKMGFNLKSVLGCQLFCPRQPTADILPSDKFLSIFSSFWWKLAQFQTYLELVWDKEKGLIIRTLCLLNTKLIKMGITQPSGGSAPWTSWMCVKPTDTNGQKHVSYKNGDGLAAIPHLKPLYPPCPFKQR